MFAILFCLPHPSRITAAGISASSYAGGGSSDTFCVAPLLELVVGVDGEKILLRDCAVVFLVFDRAAFLAAELPSVTFPFTVLAG